MDLKCKLEEIPCKDICKYLVYTMGYIPPPSSLAGTCFRGINFEAYMCKLNDGDDRCDYVHNRDKNISECKDRVRVFEIEFSEDRNVEDIIKDIRRRIKE